MRNIRFFFEEDMNINNKNNIFSLLYLKYIKCVEYMKG